MKLQKLKYLAKILIPCVMLWCASISALPIQTAQAKQTYGSPVACTLLKAGDNVKVNELNKPAIWNIGEDGLLRPYPDGNIFKSWFSNEKYSGHYKLITESCINTYNTATNFPIYVNFRPASYVIKRMYYDQLYVVLPNNTKAPITWQAAEALYGKKFKVMEVKLYLWDNYYNDSSEISGSDPMPHAGSIVKKDNKKYYVNENGTLSEINTNAFIQNEFKEQFARQLSNTYSSSVSFGTSISNKIETIVSKTQNKNITTNPVSSNSSSGATSSNSTSSGSSASSGTGTNAPSTNTGSTSSGSSSTGSSSSNTNSTGSSTTGSGTSTGSSTNTTGSQTTSTNISTGTGSTGTGTGSSSTGSSSSGSGTTYYVRTDGGSASQCNGLSNSAYPGTGTNQNCAWKHPFVALPPEGTARISGGDTLMIANGSYKMGYGASVGAENCSEYWPWDCHMPAIPSGTSSANKTRILGESWDSGCSTKPQLYGAERSYMIFDLRGTNNIEMQCLEITDRSACVEFHSGGNACNRDNYPYGNWASVGIWAEDSSNGLLKNIDVHGLAGRGLMAGRLTDWTIEDTKIQGNGWAGWDGDIDGSDSNSGTITLTRVNIDWNGCGETYPGRLPTGCWGQSAGGYGDGLGTGETGGNWIIQDSTFLHNTSDGLDLLYHRSGGTITINRVHAEGNAGNQVKTTGNAQITDSVIVGNCAYFEGKSFTHNVDACRALGNAVSLNLTGATTPALFYNNSVYSQGDGLLLVDGGGTIKARNNIFYAGVDYWQNYENSFYFYTESNTTLDGDYNLVYNAKDNSNYCATGSHNLCTSNPQFNSTSANSFNLRLNATSPAIDAGTTAITTIDFTGASRTKGSSPDMGAYEIN
ncbi:MAG: choice-of-anchor Q domain-containing protein [bacterium]